MPHYRVSFTYIEPGFARARGIEVQTYRGGFTVAAPGAEVAVMRAVELFHEVQRQSGVSWAREITTTRCEQVADATRACA